jgi:hypothetical protein
MEYCDHIFVDVHSWVREIEQTKKFPVVGAYRSSFLRCRAFTPALFFSSQGVFASNKKSFYVAIAALERYLGKKIQEVYLTDSFARCLWINSSVDHFCPLMRYEIPGMRKAAMLHDTQAFEGVYGERNKQLFMQAVEYIEIFLYVSSTSFYEFKEITEFSGINMELKRFIPMPNAHNISDKTLEKLKQSVSSESRHIGTSLSVSSLYPHKNIYRTIEVANYSLFKHFHIGRAYLENVEKFKEMQSAEKLYYLGPLDDTELNSAYRTAEAFICMSKKEGFSLPPMEAILMGVPLIILSDIPVHREIYGKYSVNFISPEMGDLSFMGKKWKKISRTDRIDLFQRFAFMNTLKYFLEFCAAELEMDLRHYE